MVPSYKSRELLGVADAFPAACPLKPTFGVPKILATDGIPSDFDTGELNCCAVDPDTRFPPLDFV